MLAETIVQILTEPAPLAVGDSGDLLVETFAFGHFVLQCGRAIAHALIEFI